MKHKSKKISREEFISRKTKEIKQFLREHLPEEEYEIEYQCLFLDWIDLLC